MLESMRVPRWLPGLVVLVVAGCGGSNEDPAGAGGTSGSGGSGPPTTTGDPLGQAHEGQYHLGPVDFAETEWHNACAPAGGYRSALRQSAGLGGEFLAGVANAYNQSGGVC